MDRIPMAAIVLHKTDERPPVGLLFYEAQMKGQGHNQSAAYLRDLFANAGTGLALSMGARISLQEKRAHALNEQVKVYGASDVRKKKICPCLHNPLTHILGSPAGFGAGAIVRHFV